MGGLIRKRFNPRCCRVNGRVVDGELRRSKALAPPPLYPSPSLAYLPLTYGICSEPLPPCPRCGLLKQQRPPLLYTSVSHSSYCVMHASQAWSMLVCMRLLFLFDCSYWGNPICSEERIGWSRTASTLWLLCSAFQDWPPLGGVRSPTPHRMVRRVICGGIVRMGMLFTLLFFFFMSTCFSHCRVYFSPDSGLAPAWRRARTPAPLR